MKQTGFLAVSFVILFSLKASAQNDSLAHKKRHRTEAITEQFRDTFNFVQLRNDPASAANLTLRLDPVYFELYGLNSNLGYAASLRYRCMNKMAIEAGYRGSYYESVEKVDVNQVGSFGGPATGTANVQNVDLNLDYFFNSRMDTAEESVNIGRYRGFTLRERVAALFQAQYGLRLGLQYYQTFVSGNQVYFSGYYENDPSKRIVNFGLEQIGTMMQENIVNLGLSITGRHDLLISNQTLGKSKVMNETYIYGDVLYAPELVYTNVIAINYENISREKYTDFNVNDNTLKSRLGFRIGFDYTDLDVAGLTFGMEAGFRPGPTFISGLYVMGKFGIAINAKI